MATPPRPSSRGERIRPAFVAALQYLPARQRAVLILHDVLRWRAAEGSELLGTSAASVRSALQRAPATLAALDLGRTDPLRPQDAAQRALLDRYVAAFERSDIRGWQHYRPVPPPPTGGWASLGADRWLHHV